VSPKILKSTTGAVFVKENTGNIKDYYKISSCIGRGKSTHIFQSKWRRGIKLSKSAFIFKTVYLMSSIINKEDFHFCFDLYIYLININYLIK